MPRATCLSVKSMNDSSNIPPTNDEQKLVRAIGLRLKGSGNNIDLDDPLINILDQYAELQNDEYEIPQEQTDNMWNHIRRTTQISQKPATIHAAFNLRKFAVAASILIVAAVGIFWSLNRSSSELIFATGDSIDKIKLEDGTEVVLRPHSQLYSDHNKNYRSYRLIGEGKFEVSHDANRPFQVMTDHGIVEVLGTVFNVSTWGDLTTVYLFEGSVSVRSEPAGEVQLEPGQVVSLSEDKLSDVKEAGPETYSDWLNNTLVFSSTDLAEVVFELEHHYNIRITISESLDNSPVSGTLRLTTLDQTLEELGLVIGAQFTKLNDDLYRLQPIN